MSITQINYMSPGVIDVMDSVGNKTRTQFASTGQITTITTFTGSHPNRSVVSTAGFGSELALVVSITTTEFALDPAATDASDRFIDNLWCATVRSSWKQAQSLPYKLSP